MRHSDDKLVRAEPGDWSLMIPIKHLMDTDEEDVAKLNMIDANEQKMYIAYYFSVKTHPLHL